MASLAIYKYSKIYIKLYEFIIKITKKRVTTPSLFFCSFGEDLAEAKAQKGNNTSSAIPCLLNSRRQAEQR